jgi:glutamyl/glutaminyl-tRNA synthetase
LLQIAVLVNADNIMRNTFKIISLALSENNDLDKLKYIFEGIRVYSGMKSKNFYQIIRLMLTGCINTPDLFDIIRIIGTTESSRRIDYFLSRY